MTVHDTLEHDQDLGETSLRVMRCTQVTEMARVSTTDMLKTPTLGRDKGPTPAPAIAGMPGIIPGQEQGSCSQFSGAQAHLDTTIKTPGPLTPASTR